MGYNRACWFRSTMGISYHDQQSRNHPKIYVAIAFVETVMLIGKTNKNNMRER